MDTKHQFLNNIKYYPYYQFFRNCFFWGPAFFLYFTSVLTLAQTLWLESIYYIWVAITEVPSGYLSDRFGRKAVLMISSACLSMAYLLFFLGNSFAVFTLAQVFMATGFAFASGTDTALHYESLHELNLDQEYREREARSLKFSFVAGAVGALAGGWIAVYHLKWIYAASFAASMSSLALLWRMMEPGRMPGEILSMHDTVGRSFKKAWARRFRFFTLYSLTMTVLLHFPYEFYQPYLEKVANAMGTAVNTIPGLTGIHLAATMLIGSWFTRFGKDIRHRCRIRKVLIGTVVLQLALIIAMALVIHPVVAALILLRTASKAISTPLINGELTPLLEQSERSTYLSLQSLMGRVSYGIILLVLSFCASLFTDAFHGTLISAAVAGSILLLLVYTTPFPKDKTQHCCSDHKHIFQHH